jgi:hypothetical protein
MPLRRLTYANVVSTLCLFLVLGGGAAFAASELAKNSVGTEQIRRGAVTPAKLSAAAKRVAGYGHDEYGRVGPVGPQGKQGPVGPPGKEGPIGTGPQAITFEAPVTTSFTVLKTFSGVEVQALCQPSSSVALRLEVVGGSTNTLDVFGTSNNYEVGEDVIPIDTRNASGMQVNGASGPHEVDLDVIARNTAVSKAFGRFDLHLDADSCVLRGMHTQSVLG